MPHRQDLTSFRPYIQQNHLEIVVAQKAPSIPLPTDWPKHVKTGILHVIALAQVALTAASARSATKRNIIVRLRAELAEAQSEICLLEEELRLNNRRMERLMPRRRPHYRGTERMAILELRAARGWSKVQTAVPHLGQGAPVRLHRLPGVV